MQCPQCGAENAKGASVCSACRSDLSDPNLTAARPEQTLVSEPGRTPAPNLSRGINENTALGERYHIVQRLGEGGMGEVFLARDRELDRDVALKVIRVDLASHPAILERFKREIQLSSNITHKNVLRVYDLGEAAGVKFLTMQYVDGQDLSTAMRREGRLPLPRVIDIFRQICEGLQAAHDQGVIHRDLKPQNIMIDHKGRVLITDFGLAKSVEYGTLTEAGKVIGTPHYMSPEQVKGIPLDSRSDLYSLGIILYEMLTGSLPFTGSSAYEVMIQRTTRTPRPASDHNPKIPPYLLKILDRCLQPDPNLRYASAAEILRDLDSQSFHGSLQYSVRKRSRLSAIVVSIVAIVLLGGGILGWRAWIASHRRAAEAAHKPVSVLVADMTNKTGDAVFDGTLEPIVTIALEGASFVNAFSRGTAHKDAAQIQPNATALDERLARLVAVRDGVNVVVSGTIDRSDSYRLALHAVDAVTGNEIGTSEVTASTKEQVLAAVGRAAADLRKALGDTTPMSAQLAAAETFTTSSLEAAHEYAMAQDLFYRGKFDDAIQHFQQAIKLDPNMGRAYAGMASSYGNMGRMTDCEAEFKLAMAHLDRMTDREKYRTRANYYILTHNNEKTIEEVTELLKHYPVDVAGLNTLAFAYFNQRDMAKALEASQKPIELYPNNVVGRNNAALYAMYAGSFDVALQQAQKVLQINPKYEKAYIAIALSQLGQGNVAAATETYQKLQAVSERGASMAAMGLADVALYEGRDKDAAALLTPAIDRDRAGKRGDPANQKLATLAECTHNVTKADEAAKAASPDPLAIFTAARTLIAAKKDADALRIASQLGSHIDAEDQMYGKVIEGEVALSRGDARAALADFDAAKKLANSWLAQFDRGRAYLDLNAFTEAEGDFEACLKRRGEATAVFLNDIPTLHYLPPVYYYLGRAQEGLRSGNATNSYQQFLSMKKNGDGDPLVADARRRVGGAK